MASHEHMEAFVDKFVFHIARDRRYTDADVWAKQEENRVRVGLTDFLQQKSGDVAFVTCKGVGTVVKAGDEIAAIETIKVDLIIPAPLRGAVVSVNGALAEHPELVNTDPYGEGWLVDIEPEKMPDYEALLAAEAYLLNMTARAELERR